MVDLQNGEDVHSIRSMDLQDFADDEQPLQEHHLDHPIQLPLPPPPRSQNLDLFVNGKPASGCAYTNNSSSDNDDDMDTVSVESKPASAHRAPSSPHLQPSSVLAISSRMHAASPGAAPSLRRPNSAMTLAQTAAYERKRIYFENQNSTSSMVFKLYRKTTVLDVRKSMANKIKIPLADFSFYVIVVASPSGDNGALS